MNERSAWFPAAAVIGAAMAASAAEPALPAWKHLSSRAGDLPVPNGGSQQTACVVFDIDRDGRTDVILAERTQAPAIVWMRPSSNGWAKYTIDGTRQCPEAGGLGHDVDGDGDRDLVIGGDYRSDELWWYENPAPSFEAGTPWRRHVIKKGGGKAHHDQAVGDFTGAGRPQLAFWNQGARKLFLADIPVDPRGAAPWPATAIFDASAVGGPTKQEGLFACDIDGDGRTDLLGGQFWFRGGGDGRFRATRISDRPGRVVAGRFKPGRHPQIVLAPGDGNGPLQFIECEGDPADPAAWRSRPMLGRDVIAGHTLEVADLNGDRNPDLFCAEMHTPGAGDRCTAWILYGDGRGGFRTQVLSTGIGNHDSRVADVNGDGRPDIVTKPYTWDTPRWDVWINLGCP